MPNRRISNRSNGYRSLFEERVAQGLIAAGIPFRYEEMRIPYVKDQAFYKPDFVLPNGIIIEAKGLFDSADRSKMKLVKKQHPNLDIRFVFMQHKCRLGKGSKTTYGQWATAHGFPWHQGHVPAAWFDQRN